MGKFTGSFNFTPSPTPGHLFLQVFVHERNDRQEVIRTSLVKQVTVGMVHEPKEWAEIWPLLIEMADTAYTEMSASYDAALRASESETNARPGDTTVPFTV